MILETLTALLLFVTGFYAWSNFHMMKANERAVAAMEAQNAALTRPYVEVVPRSDHHGLFYLQIANRGKTAAYNVRLSLSQDFYQFGDDRLNLREATAFQDPIETLPPGAEITFDLAQGWVILGEKADPERTPPVFSIHVQYTFAKTTVSETVVIDLRPYDKSTEYRSQVGEELKKVRQTLEKMLKKK